jgi:hypothetical protein
VKTLAKVGVGCAGVAAVVSIGLAVVGPSLLREGARYSAPFQQMKRQQQALNEMVDKAAWKRPEKDTLSGEQLDRFLKLRQKLDTVLRTSDDPFSGFHGNGSHDGDLEKLTKVPEMFQGMSDRVGAEIDAFLEIRMTPDEYRWLERLVYERWRGALRREGTYPTALRAAALEIDAAASREKDAAERRRLERLAAELRAREPKPPEGMDAEVHRLLLARIDEIERYSMDDLARPPTMVPQLER